MSLLAPLRQCMRCARPRRARVLIGRTILSSSQPQSYHAAAPDSALPDSQVHKDVDIESESAGTTELTEQGEAKINTWFLDPSPSPTPTPSSASSSKPSSSNGVRQPIFAPYDPRSTTSSAVTFEIPELPSNTPAQLRTLHAFLTSPNSEATDVVHPHSARFFDTSLLLPQLERRGEGAAIALDERAGNWDWVGVVVVKGRGRGVVARGDGVIRRWLLKNPLSPSIPPTTLSHPKTPRVSPDADWSIVPLALGTLEESGGVRACLNVLTEEGKEKWGLEDLWRAGG